MGRVERVYIKLYKVRARERRVEGSRGETSERFAPKTFTVPVRPEVKAFFATPGLQGAGLQQNLCHFARKKEDAEKI